MKKLYTLVTALCLGAFLFMSSNLTAQNLLVNPGFETGLAAPWVVQGTTPISIDSVTVHSGTYAAHGNVEQYIDLVAGKKYHLVCWAYTTTPNINTWVGVKDLSPGGPLVGRSDALDSAGYQYIYLELDVINSASHRFWCWGQDGSDYYSDSWVLWEDGTDPMTSTTTIDKDDKIKIYNDPTVGVSINFEDTYLDATINVMDMTGKVIYSRNATDAQTVISNDEFDATGIYVIQVKTDKVRATRKVVIVK